MKINWKKRIAAMMTAAAVMSMPAMNAYAGMENAAVGKIGGTSVMQTVQTVGGVAQSPTQAAAGDTRQAAVTGGVAQSPTQAAVGDTRQAAVTGGVAQSPAQAAAGDTRQAAQTAGAASEGRKSVIVAGSTKAGSSGIKTEAEKGYPAQEQLLGGAALTMLNSQNESQMLSCLLQTNNGSLIVIDGGLGSDADYLKSQIKARGGKVAAWLITHPHGDHAGALYKILQDEDVRYATGQPAEIVIDGIYYNFAAADWYSVNDPGESTMELAMLGVLNGRPESMLHTVHKGDTITVDQAVIEVLNDRYETGSDKGNNASIVYKITINGKSILFLGDMSHEGGNRLLADVGAAALKSDIVQMAHHGQNGVSQEVYQAISPSICLWPTPAWLWSSMESKYMIQTTKNWMADLSVQRHYCMKDGDQILQ